MAMKKLIMELTGPEEALDPSIDAYALSYGWKAKVKEVVNGVPTNNEIDNPVTALEAATKPMSNHMREVVQAYFINKAQEEARTAASEQATTAMDSITINLRLENVE